jgi:hypothetical protein
MLSARDRKDSSRRRCQRTMTSFRFKLVDEGHKEASICSHAFQNLLLIGQRPWRRLMKSALSAAPGPIKHGNSGLRNRHSGLIQFETEGDVVAFLNRLGEEHGESYATRYVRERTSIGLRNDKEDVIHLPSHFTKRRLYER